MTHRVRIKSVNSKVRIVKRPDKAWVVRWFKMVGLVIEATRSQN